jgi:hypothetical protein
MADPPTSMARVCCRALRCWAAMAVEGASDAPSGRQPSPIGLDFRRPPYGIVQTTADFENAPELVASPTAWR